MEGVRHRGEGADNGRGRWAKMKNQQVREDIKNPDSPGQRSEGKEFNTKHQEVPLTLRDIPRTGLMPVGRDWLTWNLMLSYLVG